MVTMTNYRKRHRLPAIKRNFPTKRMAEKMTPQQYIESFCRMNGLKGNHAKSL